MVELVITSISLNVKLYLISLVITGARILGVTVGQALEAYGVYFVKYTAMQARGQVYSP